MSYLDLFWQLWALRDPLAIAIATCGGIATYTWITSLVTGNVSQVDRIWSISPIIFAWIFAAASNFDTRCSLLAVLITFWGVRLTYNFFRKGGYEKGSEDYRWPVLRKKMHPVVFQLFNLTFISLFQNFLLLAITLLAHIAFENRGKPLTFLDGIAFSLFSLFLLVETIADQQQWVFQCEKHAAKKRGEKRSPLAYGEEYLTQGLFAYSRHPNFISEISIWWTVYLFSVAAGGPAVNWSSAGAIVLTLLFQGSTRFTEQLSVARYPGYKLYQQRVPALLPMQWGGKNKEK